MCTKVRQEISKDYNLAGQIELLELKIKMKVFLECLIYIGEEKWSTELQP